MNRVPLEPRGEGILKIRNLRTSFFTRQGEVKAVDDVSMDIHQGRTLGIVGESGCGKSVTSLSIMQLIPTLGRIVGGQIWYEGRDLAKLSPREMRSIRGHEISMIFQEPMTSLNPVFTVGNQIQEAITSHPSSTVNALSANEVRERAIELLKWVGVPSPEKRVLDYPHQLSGGMRQRVMIAMALSCNPKILIADEPTTALDVTIQAQILDLLRSLQEKLGMALILITHDLGVIAEVADEVAVMYAGKVVEQGLTQEIFSHPKMPYTRGLLNSLPSLRRREGRLETIPGIVPNLLDLPAGCSFQDRCSYKVDLCLERPELRRARGTDSSSHWLRCWRDL